MIAEFLDSWSLFHNTYISGWMIAVLLSLVGVVVVARDQIFIGAAVAQASMLGLTSGMWVGRLTALSRSTWYQFDAFVSVFGGLFAVLGALVTGQAVHAGRESREAVTGWVFALGMSLSVLLVSHSPHGMEEVHRLLASTLIGASAADAVLFTAMAAATVLAVVLWSEPILLLVMDPEMARAAGLRVLLWDRLMYVWLGLAVAFSLRVSGMVYTFGYLVLPALVAKSVCREARSMFLVAPAVAFVTSLAAFVVAHAYDFPPAHVAVATLVVLVAVVWAWRRTTPRAEA
jgi:ABC-type Mn2+/Zn2+ transport system permease subunit